jgi:hypothetical protein
MNLFLIFSRVVQGDLHHNDHTILLELRLHRDVLRVQRKDFHSVP